MDSRVCAAFFGFVSARFSSNSLYFPPRSPPVGLRSRSRGGVGGNVAVAQIVGENDDHVGLFAGGRGNGRDGRKRGGAKKRRCGFFHEKKVHLTCPFPSMRYFQVVSSGSPIGPRACSFCVLIPTSAPKPNSPPSVNAVEAFA